MKEGSSQVSQPSPDITVVLISLAMRPKFLEHIAENSMHLSTKTATKNQNFKDKKRIIRSGKIIRNSNMKFVA